MPDTVSLSPNRRTYRRAPHGQTLIIVLAVMFVLLLIGAIFVTQIARNLSGAGASRDAQIARDLAEAGIRYCDEQLTTSVEGADWRPQPTAPFISPADPNGVTDPDAFWLSRSGLGGFTRVPLKGGRALVRVSYEPDPTDPRSNLIKIEAVGRVGELGNGDDPTVFVQNGAVTKLRRELVAYKQIGLTDYGRFVTNKSRVFSEAAIGMAATGIPIATVLGDPTLGLPARASGYNAPNFGHIVGYPIRANSSLRLVGDVFLYTSLRNGATITNNSRLLSPEGVQTAGELKLEPTRDINGDNFVDANDRQAYLNVDMTSNALNANDALYASVNDAQPFSTKGGVIRDGATVPDAQGFNRVIPRLEPPSLDTLTPGTGNNRYRQLTRESGVILGTGTNRYNTGALGWGRGIYINNAADKQEETRASGLTSGYSLRADWLNPNSSASERWQGPFYRPPGVQIELLGNKIRLIRSDNEQFRLPNNQPATLNGGKVIEIPLSDFERLNYTLPDGTPFPLAPLDHDGDNAGATQAFSDKNSYGVSLVIMAEGNVRVRGAYGNITNVTQSGETATNLKMGRVHLTIVSGGTAYIDGNIVKADGFFNSTNPDAGGLERGSTCAILAKGYVCINTTQFISPLNDASAWSPEGGDNSSPDSVSHFVRIGQGNPTYDMGFSFGLVRSRYLTTVGPTPFGAGKRPSELLFFLRHGTDNDIPSEVYVNWLINPGLTPTAVQNGYLPTAYPFQAFWDTNAQGAAPSGQLPPETYRLISATQSSGPYEQRAFPYSIFGNPLYGDNNGQSPFVKSFDPGFENVIRFQTDQTVTGRLLNLGYFGTSSPVGGTGDYRLGQFRVAPLDIRIEAMLYAQERSFFVIPGFTANPDPKDTRAAWLASDVTPAFRHRPSYTINIADGRAYDLTNRQLSPAEKVGLDLYPFYGEPMDVRITLVGSISENYTASIGDQTQWMKRWGYVPEYYGSSAVPIPDIHRAGVDDNPEDKPASASLQTLYSPGTETGVDFRTPIEKAQTIARGLRYIYDPAFAYPYKGGNPDNRPQVRGGSEVGALRSIERTVVAGGVTYRYLQALPPLPKLPVCPGLLYFGEPEGRISASVTKY